MKSTRNRYVSERLIAVVSKSVTRPITRDHNFGFNYVWDEVNYSVLHAVWRKTNGMVEYLLSPR